MNNLAVNLEKQIINPNAYYIANEANYIVAGNHYNSDTWYELRVSKSLIDIYLGRVFGLDKVNDRYVTQNLFFGRRLAVNLFQLTSCYVDCDYHNSEKWGNTPAEQVASAILDKLDLSNKPAPSEIRSTGRGVLVIWNMDHIPSQALPRWNLVQSALCDSLSEFGADKQAKDASRVFRLVGSYNSKVDKQVKVIWRNPVEQNQDFDQIADNTLEFTREEWKEKVASFALAKANKLASGKIKTKPNKVLTKQTWAMTLLTDLQKLINCRYENGIIPQGMRDRFLFIAGVALSHSVPANRILFELDEFISKHSDLTPKQVKSYSSSTIKRAVAAEKGEKLVFNGKQVDPRYLFKTETLIQWLNITSGEMEHLSLLVDQTIDRSRRAEKKRQFRLSKGMEPWDRKREELVSLGEKIINLRSQGFAQTEICRGLNISHKLYYRALQITGC